MPAGPIESDHQRPGHTESGSRTSDNRNNSAPADTVNGHAGRIESIMGDLAAGQQAQAHAAWNTELSNLAKHDSAFIKSVFDKVKSDAPNSAYIDSLEVPSLKLDGGHTQMMGVKDGPFALGGSIEKDKAGGVIELDSLTRAGNAALISHSVGDGALK